MSMDSSTMDFVSLTGKEFESIEGKLFALLKFCR
jgi:hypothetical protein